MWGAIKKAINSNLNKPLDTHITEEVGDLKAVTGVNGQASGTTTIMGALRRIWESVGLVGDAANATGALNAKVRDVKNAVVAYSPINSIQRGSATTACTTITVTIAAINTARAFLTFSTCSNADAQAAFTPAFSAVRGEILNATQIRFSRGNSSYGITMSWEVVEYK